MSNLQENYINPFDNESLSFQVLKISKVNLVYGLRSIRSVWMGCAVWS